MGQDMSTWERISYGQTEADARMRIEHARFKATLLTISDGRQTADGARLLATHALQDGHTTAAPPNSVDKGMSGHGPKEGT